MTTNWSLGCSLSPLEGSKFINNIDEKFNHEGREGNIIILFGLLHFLLPRNNSRVKTVKKESDLCFAHDFQQPQRYELEATHLADAPRPLTIYSITYFHFLLSFWIISMAQLKAAELSA